MAWHKLHFGNGEIWMYRIGNSYVNIIDPVTNKRTNVPVGLAGVSQHDFNSFLTPSDVKEYIWQNLFRRGPIPERGTRRQFKAAILRFFDPNARTQIPAQQEGSGKIQRFGRKKGVGQDHRGRTRRT